MFIVYVGLDYLHLRCSQRNTMGIGGFHGGIYMEKSRESGGINFC